MPLNVKDDEVHRNAKELASLTGETITEAVRRAIRERLTRVRRAGRGRDLSRRLAEIAGRCSARPVLDVRSDEEILGYDDTGVPRRW